MSLIPILASLQAQRPIPTAAGLPQLQPDLSWDADCPLHIMGAFAQLELGPDALNLAGARSGGVIIARAVLEERARRAKQEHVEGMLRQVERESQGKKGKGKGKKGRAKCDCDC